MKRFFKCLVVLLAIAAAATGSARAQSNTVRWEKFQISEFNLMQGDRETIDDVTIACNGGSASNNGGDIKFDGEFTFSVPAGSVLTQIVIRDETWLSVTGWSRDESQTEATWTGSARSVACQITTSNAQYIEFTIASAVPKMYTSEVSITDLVPGDTLAEGATIIGSGNDEDMVFLAFGRAKENGVVPQFWTNLGLPPTAIGTNGTIYKTNTYTPVDGNGQDGSAWVVTSALLNYYDGFEVGLSGITIPVYRTLDSIPMGWTVKVGEAAAVSPTAYTDGGSATKGFLQVEQGQPVLLVPSAEDKPLVKSVTLTEVVSLATPLTMEALTAGTIVVNSPKSGMQYSKNGGAKTAMNATTTINVAAGDKVAFYGNGTSITQYFTSTSNYTKIAGGTAKVKVYGNIMSLVDEENFATATTLSDYAFRKLFDGNATLTDASELLLPATTLAQTCYGGMFMNCSTLVAAPALPATTLASYCYNSMFGNCTALTTAPELPATTLVHYCYFQMFYNCSKLSSVTCLATSGIDATNCITNWLQNAGTNVNGTKTFTAATETEWPSGVSGIPSGWTRLNPDGSEWVAPNPMLGTPLTLEATTAGTIVVDMSNGSLTMKYSKNGGAKTTINATTTINVAAGDKVQFYGNGTNTTSYYGTRISGGMASVKVYGNMMSLVDEENFATATTLSSNAFRSLFDGNATLTDASELLLPATTLADHCYYYMFSGCGALTTAPALPATTLADYCYYGMFMGCSALTTAPALPATTLANNCYYYMFSNCSALTTAPVLPAATLANYCYYSMFYGCTKLSSVTCLATSISAPRCLNNWLYNAGTSAASPTLHVKASMGSASWNNGSFAVTPDQP